MTTQSAPRSLEDTAATAASRTDLSIASLRQVSIAVDSEMQSAIADPTSIDVVTLAEASVSVHRALLALESLQT